MRILLVQDTDWVRRNPVQHNHVIERMVRKGHEVRVIDYEILWREEKYRKLIAPRRTFTVSRLFPDAKHTLIRPSYIRASLLDYASMLVTYRREIRRQLREFQPDFVLGDGVLTPKLAFAMARKNGARTVYCCVDVDYRLIPYKFIQPLGKMLESSNMKNADLVVSINEVLRDYTVKMGARKTEVIRAGVDFTRFNPGIDGTPIREKYGIAKSDKVLLFVGWLYHFAGLKEAVKELSITPDPSLKLLLVGEGDAARDLSHLRDSLNLGDRVIMAGRQPYDAIPQFIAAADICLLPFYHNEITRYIVPIKLYEYMALGKPVVATKLDGVYREFGDGNGIIYCDSPEGAVTTALKILNEGKVREQGEKARAFVSTLSWDKIVSQFEDSLHKLIKTASSGVLEAT